MKELDVVYLLEDVLDAGLTLRRGERGTIVHEHLDGWMMVEFVNEEDGSTRGLVTLDPRILSLTPPPDNQ